MKEVEQTRIGMEGNCFAACVASILELPIEAVPDYTEQAGGWFYRWQVWLVERGLRFRIIPANQGGAIGYEPPAGWAIMNVKSLTLPGELHSVVSWNGQMKWNPHPQREKGVGEVVDYYIFEALDPSKLLQPIAVLSAPPIEPVGIREALRDACSLARGLLLLTKMDGWKNLNKHTDEALLAKCEAALASKDAELAKCANLVAQEARAHGDTKAELAAVVRFVQRVAGDVTRQEPSNPNVLDDGFGNQWLKCSRPGGCGLQIVRPGKVQCDCEQEKQEDGAGDGDMGLNMTPNHSLTQQASDAPAPTKRNVMDICARCGQGKANHDMQPEILCAGFLTEIPAAEQLANIYDFLSEVDDLSLSEIREELFVEGIDYDDFVKRTKSLIWKLSGR